MTLRHLFSPIALTDDDTHPVAVNEESAGAGAAPSPAPATSIAPWELEDGDLLVDHPAARVRLPLFYTAGQWLVYDGDDRLIARLPHGVDVQVVRAEVDLAAGVGRHPAGGAR